MLRLSKKADYALIAMKHLALDGGGHASARSIAECYGIPNHLMAKILQTLVQKGLLQSQHGLHGGYELTRSASAISVLEVVQAIDGPLNLTACSPSDRECDQFRSCSVRRPLWQIRKRILESLTSFSLRDLIDSDA